MKNLFIGIDFSKEKVSVSIIRADGLSETAPRAYSEFQSSLQGYRQLLRWVERNADGLDPSAWLFCGESTGDCGRPLSNFLYGRGYDLWIENPRSIRDASGIRRLKSDRADSSMIAEYAMRHHDRAVLYEPPGESLCQLRELFLYRQMLVRHRRSFQVRTDRKRRFMEKSPARAMIARSGRHIVSELNREVEKTDRRIAGLIDSDEGLREVFAIVTSVPGMGTQNAVCLMAYTDNFRRFGHDPRRICCYYGIAPFGRDSGTSVHSDPHVHCMANRQIKAMLTQAALAATRFNPLIARYYARLLERGKKKQVALNNVKNKLIHIVTAMVRDRRMFSLQYHMSA